MFLCLIDSFALKEECSHKMTVRELNTPAGIFVFMAKYRPIKTSFWDDDYVLSLKTDEKLLFLFLITNTYTTLCGMYKLSVGYTYRITGISEKRIVEILQKFSQDGKVKYHNGWVFVVNMRKHQTASPHIATGIEREEKEIPQEIKETLYRIDTVSIGMDKPILKLIPKLELKPLSTSKEVDSATALDAPKEYGKKEINEILLALRRKVGVDDFRESSAQQRIWGANLHRLMAKIGASEFSRRLDIILADDFKRKNCGSLQYVYKEIKGFVEPAEKRKGVFIS